MLPYKIEKIKILHCRVIKVERKVKDKKILVIIYFGQYDDGKFICTLVREEYEDDPIYEYQKNKKKLSIEKILICPNVKVYHTLTWDDVHKGKCSTHNLYEIERDKDGEPIIYEKVIMFVNLEDNLELANNDSEMVKRFKDAQKINKRDYEISKILQKEYVAINSPNVQNKLKYRNFFYPKYYKEQFYTDYDNYNYNDVDSTPENDVMDALENGMGELLGF